MARASLNTADILKINEGKIKTFVIISPDSTDQDDVELFVVVPPPPVPDTAHRAPIQSMTSLCDNCRVALEYCSYFFATLKSAGEDAVEDLPPACLLHGGAETAQKGDDDGCHLCVLVMSNLRTKRLSMESIDQSNIELCWQMESDQTMPARIHLALTHNGHGRSAQNYWNFLKLKLWPFSEFGPSSFGISSSSELVLSGSTDSEQSRDKALQWLSRCEANENGRHAQCIQESQGWLPTRLLDVTHAMETLTLKLVAHQDDPNAFVSNKKYITLSHCWGKWGSAALPVLTTANLGERTTQGISLALLPKSFKEAIEIAHWFHVRWLWIDSLCILQDSRDDWEQEAVMMYSVYKHALLNISADDSNDARWGCFRNRHPLAVCPMRLKFPWQDSDNSTYWLTPDSNALFEGITSAPLARRAWVFQERQLSRRVLHFTSTEMIWECCAEGKYFASETFPEGAPFETVFNDRPKYQSRSNLANTSSAELYKTWDMLCMAYSEKKLSHIDDKLVALSGLTQEFQATLPNDSCVAGLWRSTLPRSLLWTSENDCGRIETDKPNVFIAPSWSWLSMDGSISEFAPQDTTSSLVEILNINSDTPITSGRATLVGNASIDLRCYLRHVEIFPDYEEKPWYMMAMGGGQQHRMVIGDGEQEVNLGSDRSFSFDMPWSDHSGPTSVSGYFLPVSIHQSPTRHIRGLLVQPVKEDSTTFRRIGVMSVRGAHCIRLAYRLKGVKEKTLWNSLEELLRSNYEASDTFRESTEVDSEQESSGNSSFNDGVEEHNSLIGNVKDMAEKEMAVRDEIILGENDRDGVERLLTELDIKESCNAADEPQKSPDLESIGTLERLYALDIAFHGSQYEANFERLLPQQIKLI